MTDEQTPTEPSAETPIAAPFVLVIPITLPEEIAPFGIAEEIKLPGDLFDLNFETHGDMVAQAVQAQMSHATWSLTTTLNAVLAMRAQLGRPITHEEYIAEQTRRQEELAAARAQGQAAARAAAQEVAGQ